MGEDSVVSKPNQFFIFCTDQRATTHPPAFYRCLCALVGGCLNNEWEVQVLREKNWSHLYVNFFELQAVRLIVQHFLPQLSHSTLLILTDNTTALAYIKNQGGTWSHFFFMESNKLLNLCAQNNVIVRTQHIPAD